ncbi:unnamed protein product, partial [Amoebophrya sp. A25]
RNKLLIPFRLVALNKVPDARSKGRCRLFPATADGELATSGQTDARGFPPWSMQPIRSEETPSGAFQSYKLRMRTLELCNLDPDCIDFSWNH